MSSGAAERCDGLSECLVAYVDEAGGDVQMWLRDAAALAFEVAAPVRSFPSYRGQRNFPGFYYAACTDRHVGFESWLERDEAMAMDFDPQVTAFAPQPFRLSWNGGQQKKGSHTPDFFARRRDGAGVVVDCRPQERIKDRDRELFEATAEFCALIGWEYRLVTGHDPVWLGNVRWLAGYRQRRYLNQSIAQRLVESFAEPTPLLHGASGVGDPIAVLPVLYHLLWIGLLWTDLTSRLEASSLVAAP